MRQQRTHFRAEGGATTVEYATMVALIAGVLMLGLVFLGRSSSSTFRCTGQAVSTKSGVCSATANSAPGFYEVCDWDCTPGQAAEAYSAAGYGPNCTYADYGDGWFVTCT